MEKFAVFVTTHCRGVVIGTFVLMVLCGVLALTVGINYDLTGYLPQESESTRAITIMNREFTSDVPNAQVMVDDLDLDEALATKKLIESAPGVTAVQWLDDVVDLGVPLGAQDSATVEAYFKDGHALYNVTIETGREVEAREALYEALGDAGHITGEANASADTQGIAATEVGTAFAILVPLILILLLISTTSWLEPLLFLLAIAVAIVFNMGTNVFFGELDYLAYMIAPILQLAVSLDYSIFLLHAFGRRREYEPDATLAMQGAIVESSSSVAASAATTMFGFAALGFMQFGVGAELGITLCKGVIFSFLSTMIFLPAFTLLVRDKLEKLRHRPLLPDFKNIGRVFRPLQIPVFILAILLIVPCVLAEQNTYFTYGMGRVEGTVTRSTIDEDAIKAVFGRQTPIVVLVPRGEVGSEAILVAEIEEIPEVTSVVSYPTSVGAGIPIEFLDKEIQDQFYSEHYARIIVYADIPVEGPVAFDTIETIRGLASDLYGQNSLVAGEPASLYDMKLVTTVDSRVTNALAIIAILLVLIVTFRAAILPVILLATIEMAIIINLSIPYFSGHSLNYLGFLVINTVQLGATVDYAILFTNTYLGHRRSCLPAEAIYRTSATTFKSIVISATILALAGAVLAVTSTNAIVAILGILLCRGTILSALMVLTFLPAALRLFDKAIEKTTVHAVFFRGD